MRTTPETPGRRNVAGDRLGCLVRHVLAATFVAVAGSVVVGPAVAQVPDGGAVILAYGRFGEDDSPSSSVRIDQFEDHLAELTSGEYSVLPLARVVAALRDGTALPDRTVVITIDEAWRSVYAQALPRLRAAGLPFTLFVSTDPLDRGAATHMSWAELREVAAAGATIAAMPAAALPMTGRPLEESAAAIRRSVDRIAAELRQTPTLFAYPHGEFGLAHRALVEQARFVAAFGQQSGAAGRGADHLALPRFVVNEAFGGIDRFLQVTAALPLPVADITPVDPLIRQNPPAIGFTLADRVANADRLACFASGIGRTALERLGTDRIEIRFREPLAPGRLRVNCTVPAIDGRWHWFGLQLFVPN
ncbi:MAG: polysaccharide deacetylase family protein [Rhodospirillales bacterium]|jgi:peptidoglycan/xylan/chitin deacetylase (PgdA/CDA1 family)